ncbi:MAG: hypothetical protein ACXVC6_06970 [Bacteroidia bacterium]
MRTWFYIAGSLLINFNLFCQNPLNSSYAAEPDGETRMNYHNGQPHLSFTKVNGNIQGEYKFYNKDGTIAELNNFDQGHFNGINLSFDKNGDTTSYEVNKHDTLIFLKNTSYYPNRKIKDYYTVDFSDSTFLNTFPGADSTHKTYFQYDIFKLIKTKYNKNEFRGFYKSGKLKFKVNGIKYMYNGPYTEYYESGKIKIDCNYKNDELNGKYIMYNEDGSFKVQKYYENGVEVKIEQ